MKIKFCGVSAVDIAGHDGVEPGDVVDVPEELAERLLFAGSQVLDDGTVVPPVEPVWVKANKDKAAPVATDAPVSGQEG